MSQKQLAEDAGVGRTHTSRLENGHSMPTLTIVSQLCRSMERDPTEIVNATLELLPLLNSQDIS